MNVTVLPRHRCELIYLMSIVLMKDIGTNMRVLGPPPMPLGGTKIAKSRFEGVPPLKRTHFWAQSVESNQNPTG